MCSKCERGDNEVFREEHPPTKINATLGKEKHFLLEWSVLFVFIFYFLLEQIAPAAALGAFCFVLSRGSYLPSV